MDAPLGSEPRGLIHRHSHGLAHGQESSVCSRYAGAELHERKMKHLKDGLVGIEHLTHHGLSLGDDTGDRGGELSLGQSQPGRIKLGLSRLSGGLGRLKRGIGSLECNRGEKSLLGEREVRLVSGLGIGFIGQRGGERSLSLEHLRPRVGEIELPECLPLPDPIALLHGEAEEATRHARPDGHTVRGLKHTGQLDASSDRPDLGLDELRGQEGQRRRPLILLFVSFSETTKAGNECESKACDNDSQEQSLARE